MEQAAIMEVLKGETIVTGMVSGHIPGTGRYKFLAKKKLNGKIEWAHFIERDNGMKEKLYRGEVKDRKELELLLQLTNKTLVKVFGEKAELKKGIAECRWAGDAKSEDRIR